MFKLVQNGTEQVNEVYVKSDADWVKLDDTTVIMQDAPVLDIDKTDIAANLLPGATLTIRDADSEVIDTWVTDYKTHRVPISDDFLKLSDDSKEYIYTLTEDAARPALKLQTLCSSSWKPLMTGFLCSSAKMPMPNGCAPTNA